MAHTSEVGTDLLARPREITGRLKVGRRHRHHRQRAGQQQPHQQLGVLAVGLDPIGGRARRL